MFYYVYILESINNDYFYTGFTSDLSRRFSEHNRGKTVSTSSYKPFKLIHYEAYRNKEDALRREKYLKSSKGKTVIRMMLKKCFLDRIEQVYES